MCQEALKSIDFFGEKPQLLYDKHSRYRTFIGGVLSIAVSCILFAAIMYFLVMFLNRSNSTISYNQVPSMGKERQSLANLPLVLMLQNNLFQPLLNEERLYKLYPTFWEWNYKFNSTTGEKYADVKVLNMTMEKCDINKHFGNHSSYFKDIPYLSDHYCILPNSSFPLFGLYGATSDFSMFNFFIRRCINDSSPNQTDCENPKVIEESLNDAYVSFQFLDYSINHSDVNSPGQLYLRSDGVSASNTIFKRLWYYVKNIKYYTDLGYMFESTEEQDFFQISSVKETTDLRTNVYIPGSFVVISFAIDVNYDTYNRSYTKLQNFMANAGGIIKGVTLIAQGVNYILTFNLYYLDLANCIFQEVDHQKIKKNESSGKNVSSFNDETVGKIQNNNFIRSFDGIVNLQKCEKNQNNNNNLLIVTKKEGKSLTVSYFDRLLPLKCINRKGAKEKIKIFKTAREYIKNQISIDIFLKRIDCVEKLIHALTSRDQKIIFSNIIPTYQSLDLLGKSKGKSVWKYIYTHSNSDFDLTGENGEFQFALNNLKSKENKNELDQNLINLFEIPINES